MITTELERVARGPLSRRALLAGATVCGVLASGPLLAKPGKGNGRPIGKTTTTTTTTPTTTTTTTTPPPPPPPAPSPSADYPQSVLVAQQSWDAKSVYDLPGSPLLAPLPTKVLPAHASLLPVGTQYQNGVVYINAPGVVLDGWDFRASKCAVRVESTNCRITNSIFGGQGVHVPLWVGRYTHGSSCVVANCEFDGTGCGTVFAGIFQLGYGSTAADTTSSLTLSYCHIHNAPRQTACQSGNFVADHCWFGAAGVNGIAGDHVSCSHVYGGSASFTNCLFDAKDGWGLTATNNWTAFIYYEPYSGASITAGLIENCIFANPDPTGWYMIDSINVGTKTVSNLIIRNNVIQAGAGGRWFYPPLSGIVALHDNLDLLTATPIMIPSPIV